MVKYILKRVGYSLITLFVLITVTFFLMQLLPGDPFTGEKKISEAIMANMMAKYGLDKPVTEQYVLYLGNVLHGDFGVSLGDNRPVTDKLMMTFLPDTGPAEGLGTGYAPGHKKRDPSANSR